MKILDIITALSHEFGTGDYVCGGGGNTSCKSETTLWVKPSGTTLSGLTPEKFISIDRSKLAKLYQLAAPAVAAEREVLVKSIMDEATLSETAGRASVEAPLHDALSARYVVHTHPFIVNGMTAAKEGKVVCKQLFPDALWLDYVDPGYTLCMVVSKEIELYQERNGHEPELIFLKNHGVFVSADSPERIRELYAEVMNALKSRYVEYGLNADLEISSACSEESADAAMTLIRGAMDNQDLFIASSGLFAVVPGPISPDHMVYAKAYPYVGQPTKDGLAEFVARYGYAPQVFVFNECVFGVAESGKGAKLALELAKDGAVVKKLCTAFGGVNYMSDSAREFIENWEVESYRKKQI